MPVKLLPDGRIDFNVSADWAIIGPNLADDLPTMASPGALHPKVTPAIRKVAAAQWFLKQLERCQQNEAAALMFLDGFLSEMRSTTFMLQASFGRSSEFVSWYESKRIEMRSDQNTRWLVDARNVSQKVGIKMTNWGLHLIVRFPLDGAPYAESLSPTLAIAELDRTVTTDDLHQIWNYLKNLVDEAHERFHRNVPERSLQMQMETVRERLDGTWEHFNVGPPATQS